MTPPSLRPGPPCAGSAASVCTGGGQRRPAGRLPERQQQQMPAQPPAAGARGRRAELGAASGGSGAPYPQVKLGESVRPPELGFSVGTSGRDEAWAPGAKQ